MFKKRVGRPLEVSQPGQPRAAAGTRVVVVGAGFAGLAAVSEFEGTGIKVTLIDKHYYTTFQPLLYQVATAALDAGDVAFSTRAVVRHRQWVDFRQGCAVGVDWDHKRVLLLNQSYVEFDYLILAVGADINFFGVQGAAEHSLAIYSLDDALEVRARLYDRLEAANANPDKQAGALTFVVVGGGATGVEMAGSLAELLHASLFRDYPHLDRAVGRVVLVEQLDRLLVAFDAPLGRYVVDELSRRGVEVRLGESVKEIRANEVLLGSGESLAAGAVIWAAGVSASSLGSEIGVETGRGGRIVVGADLQIAGRPGAFAIGDLAAVPDGSGNITPQLAQPAIQSGKHAAGQIRRLVAGEPTVAFKYKDKGTMATVGRHAAIAQLPGNVNLKGSLAWFAWLALHLVTLLGMRNRIAVLINWTWRYLSWGRGPRLIVGAETGRLSSRSKA